MSDYLVQVDHTRTQTFDPLEGKDNPNPPSGAFQRPSLSFQYANLGDVNDADLVERVLEIWHAHQSMPEEAADVRLRAVNSELADGGIRALRAARPAGHGRWGRPWHKARRGVRQAPVLPERLARTRCTVELCD